MVWKLFKILISIICLSVATLIIILEPIDLGTLAFASIFVFLAGALWIDYTKSQDKQNVSNTQRKIAKVVICGLIALFIIMFASSFFNEEVHVNSKGFFQIITALLKAL